MKSLLIAAVVATLTLAASAAQARGSVDARQARQDGRIAAGITEGQLTRCEAARLTARESRIETAEARDRASGGGMSRVEHRNLERRLDSLSRDIREQRHDG